MSVTPSRRVVRAALVAALGTALVASTAAGSPGLVPRAQDAPDGRAEVLASFARQASERESTDLRAEPGPSAADGKDPVMAPVDGADRDLSPAPEAAGAAVADCVALGVEVMQTLDRSHVSWQPVAGATSFTVRRERADAPRSAVATGLPATATHAVDGGHNPLGLVAYHVEVGGLGLSCRSPEEGFYWSMSSNDGVGFPDAVFAGDTALYEQSTDALAHPARSTEASRPAFSPTGRLLAAVEDVGGTMSVTVRVARTGALLWSVPSPAGTLLDEPAFSPDGQRLVVEALDAADLTVSTGLFTIPVTTGSHPLTAVPGTAGLATADWVDTPGSLTATTIVAADLTPGAGLVLVNAATGARTAVAGTVGALDPVGLPDGSLLFATSDGTDATIARRSPSGSVTTLQTLVDSLVRWPVPGTNGEYFAYVLADDPGTPEGPSYSIDRFDDLGQVGTPIGGTADGAQAGFHGFDIRTYFSSGTSNLGGSATPDILARSSTGVLYDYPLSANPDRPFDARRQIGTGWNVMRQFLAAGDLNEDRRGDIIAIDTSGVLWFYPGRGNFALGARTRIGSGWSSYAIFSTGDFDGDTRADILARDSAGALWLYPGNGRGGVLARKKIGSGWQIFNAVIGPGDWNYDGTNDLLAKDRSTGVLYLYPGTGTGRFKARTVLGRGWQARNGFAAPEFWGATNSLFARTTDGLLLDYVSVGNGVMDGSAVYVAGSGWGPYSITG